MTKEKSNLLELLGDIYLAVRDASGNPKAFYFVGEAPTCTLKQSQEIEKIKNTGYGSGAGTLKRVEKGLELVLSLALRDIKKQNVKLLARGSDISISSGSVTNESLPADLAVGDFVRLANPNASSIVITDSAGTPATLTLGTHYEVVDADFGLIKILSLGAFTQPFKAAYTKAATTGVAAHTDDGDEYFLMLVGEDITSKPHRKVKFEAYRLSPGIAAEIAFKAEQAASFAIDADVLYDETRAETQFGPYYSLIYIDALES